LEAVLRILKYIKKIPNKDLIYEDKGNTQIVGYFNANLARSPSNTILWKIKKQNVVATSSAKAKYRQWHLLLVTHMAKTSSQRA